MKDQLISFHVAKLAKEKGLDLSSNYFREHESGDADFDDDFCNWNQYDGYVTIITQSLLQKFIREEHGIDILVKRSFSDGKKKYILTPCFDKPSLKGYDNAEGNTYEEALESGLMKALEMIK